MPAGDIVSNIANIASGEYLDMRPVAGVTWCIHNINYAGAMELYFYDGTNNLKLDADGTPGARLSLALHCNNTRYYRLKNVSGASTLMSYDGVQTNGSVGSSDNAEVYCGTGAADSVGVDGDLYINKTTGDIYNKSGAAWGNPIGNISGALVVKYVHTSNKSATVSSIDTNDAFVSVGHPFVTGDKIYTMINVDANRVYLPNILPMDITAATPYYVIADGLTVDTFKVSATLDGAAIIPGVNANLDFTKWHFECGTVDLDITDLEPSYKYKVHISGRNLTGGNANYLLANGEGGTNVWLVGGGAFTYASFYFGNVYSDVWIEFDNTEYSTMRVDDATWKTLNTTANTSYRVTNVNVNNTVYHSLITRLRFITNGGLFANGTIVEVYKL